MVEPQPTKKPEWNTGGANRTEPTAGEKTSGWALDDQPPSSYFNWLQYYTYAWLEWLNERFYKGSGEIDLTINALTPDTTGAGGVLTLEGGDANTTGAGGDVDITGGAAVGSGVGGNVDLQGGVGVGAVGGSTRITAGAASTGASDGGIARLRGGEAQGTGDGGAAQVWAGAADSGDGGAVDINGGASTSGAGGAVDIDAGSTAAGAGGVVTIDGGAGVGAEGGDVTITGGASDTDGGDVAITSGDASAGAGGDSALSGGASVGATGGDARLYAGYCTSGSGDGGEARVRGGSALGTGTGGDVDILGGYSANGAGGKVDIDGGQGTGAAGGAVEITGGASDTDGGDVAVTGGANTSSGTGGTADVIGGAATSGAGGTAIVKGGNSAAGVGGETTIAGGNAGGTDINAGAAVLQSGESTGSGRGVARVRVAESGLTGVTARTPSTYVEFNGGTGFKYAQFSRYLDLNNSTDTARGQARLTPKAQPTAPSAGDIYQDSSTQQLAAYNNTRYQNLNTVVYNISDDAVTGVGPTSPAVSTDYALQELPYGGSIQTSALRHIIPANTLRVGSIVRVRAMFENTIVGGSNFLSPRIYVGSVGSGPAYSSPTGVLLEAETRQLKQWYRCAIEAEMRVRAIGASVAPDYGHKAVWMGATSAADAASAEQIVNGVVTIATNAALDVFPAVRYHTDLTHSIECRQFIVEVI